MKNDPMSSRTPDEADLLAFIEGESLPRERELAVAGALAADPGLARKLERMRGDRAAVRLLPPVAAPAGLLDAVESALQPVLERQMLLGLRDGRPVEDHPPVSVVQPSRRSVLGTLFTERAGRRMALAAGLLLVVGGASYFAAGLIRTSTPATPLVLAERPAAAGAPGREDALADKEIDQRVLAKAAADRARASDMASAPAATDVAPDGAKGELALAGSSQSTAALEKGSTIAERPATEAPASPPAADAPPGMDDQRALALAREGRLVIRLRAPDPVVLAEPGRIADRIRRAGSPMWRLGDQAPQLASILHAAPPPAPQTRPAPSPEPTVVASQELPQDMYGPPAPARSAPVATLPPAPTVYLVQTRLETPALESLLRALAPYGEPAFEESASPLPLDDSLSPAAVVWWSQPPSAWAWWASVPIVIDQQP